MRELANVIERAALFADERVLTAAATRAAGSTGRARDQDARASAGAATEADERRDLLDVLTSAGWNFTHAAARLGVPRNTLRYRAERLGLAPDGAGRRRGGRPAGRPADPSAARTPAPEGAARGPARDTPRDAPRAGAP